MTKGIKDLKVHKSNGEINKSESEQLYEILESLPSPDVKMKLTAAQKYWWYFFGKEFCLTKQFSKLDLMHLQNAAVSMDARCKLVKKINDLNKEDAAGVAGWVQIFKTGASNITGYQTMYEKATKQLDDVSAHFGLSIRDRQKLKIEKADESQLSLFEMYLQKKTN